MRMMNEYEWAQGKVSESIGYTKEQREGAACQRRLRQMEAKRAKQAARKAKAIPDGDGVTSDIGAGSGD